MQDYISASEIGEYLYCQRAWWFRRQGVETSQPEVLKQGTEQHEELTKQVRQIERGSRIGRQLLWIGFVLFVFVLVVKFISQ
jgi:CRISPR/Cas system-associated exonuclease Cas4 (RecB family)